VNQKYKNQLRNPRVITKNKATGIFMALHPSYGTLSIVIAVLPSLEEPAIGTETVFRILKSTHTGDVSRAEQN